MEKTIVFATGNEGKMREVRMILSGCRVRILSMKEAGISVKIEENGETFEENALIKARTVGAQTDAIVLADDSGLEIDALNGAPGIRSARYLGEDTPYEVKNAAILDLLKDVPEERRTARFVCAIACVLPDGGTLTSRGTMEGIIGFESRGENGFGYDPIFYLPDRGCSSAELSPEEKNARSHRGRALRRMRELLENKGIL